MKKIADIIIKLCEIISILSIILFVFLTSKIFTFIYSYLTDDKDACLDIGICKEGLQLNTEHGLITINKETCLKYNWEWRDDWKDCHIR